MDERTLATPSGSAARRLDAALRRRANWEQLVKFCAVGATGYIVNLAVYTALLRVADLHYASRPSARSSSR